MAGASYTARANLTLRSNVAQQLRSMSTALAAFDRRLTATGRSMNTLLGNMARLNAATSALRNSTTRMSALGTAASGVASRIGNATSRMNALAAAANTTRSGMSRAATATDAQARALGNFATAAQRATQAQAMLARAPSVTVPRLPRGGAGGGGASGRGGGHGTIGDSRFERARAAAELAHPAIGFVERAIHQGAEFGNQRALLNVSGAKPEQVAAATNQAWVTAAQVGGVTASHALHTMGELQSAFGSLDEARQMSVTFERFGRMFELATGRSAEGQLYDAAKILERRGAIYKPGTHELDNERSQAELMEMARSALVTQGRVGPSQIRAFLQTGSIPASMMSDAGFWNTVTPLIQVMGASSAGTAMQAMTRQYVGSIIDQRRLTANQQMGLIDPSKVSKIGPRSYQLHPGAITGEHQLLTDIVGWTRDVMVPQLQAHHVDITDRTALNRALIPLGQTGTLQRVMSELVMDLPRILQEMKQRAAVPIDAPQRLLADSPEQGIATVHSSFTNLMQTLGDTNMPAIAAAMRNIADGVNTLSAAIRANPQLGEWILGTAAALGGLATAAAAWTVGSVALSGLTAVGSSLLGLGTPAAAFAAGTAAAVGLAALPGLLAGLAGAVIGLPAILKKGADLLGIQGTPGATRAGTGAAAHNVPPPGGGMGPRAPGQQGPTQSWGDWLDNQWHNMTHGPATPQNLLPRRGSAPTAPAASGDQHSDAGSNPWQYAGTAPAGGLGTVQVATALHLDGRQIAEVVTDHQVQALDGPGTTAGTFDSRRGFTQPGFA